MWMTPGCSLPDDNAWIQRRMRVDSDTFERVVLVIIEEFCERKNGRVSNAKLTQVFQESIDKHKKRVEAGSKGGKAKALKTKETDPSKARAKLKQPEPEPYKKDTNVSQKDELFDVPKRGGEVVEILGRWASEGSVKSFMDYRKKTKAKALTETAAKRLASQLQIIFNQGGDPDDALGMAEERGWQSIQADWYFNAKSGRKANSQQRGEAAFDEARERALRIGAARPAQSDIGF
jgi:uncharacterized protein YdaU (DUF1376 family)